MKKYDFALFHNITDQEMTAMLECHCMRECSFARNAVIFQAGDLTCELGIVCTGRVYVENNDFWGNKSIVAVIDPGGVFAETYALCKVPMMVDAVAAENSDILLVDLHHLLKAEKSSESWYFKILQNLLRISMQKNFALSHRIFYTTPKTVRERLLAYLSGQAAIHRSRSFVIPLNRQQMADYLNVDRSALSKELGRMRAEGMIEFHKNSFLLVKLPQ